MGNSSSSSANNCDTEELQEELDKQRRKVNEYSNNIGTLNSRINELNDAVDTIPGLNDQIADLTESNKEIPDLKKQIEELNDVVNTIPGLEKQINDLTAKANTIPGLNEQINSKNQQIKSKDDEINSKNQQITDLTAKVDTIPGLNKQIKDLTAKANTIPGLNEQINSKNQQIKSKDKQITDLTRYKTCEEENDKLIIALRRYQSATGFVKLLFDNKDWLMYIVNDFDKNWRTHKWFKYLWNIAFTFKNTTRVIILFGSRNNGISPIRSPANFKSINKGFIAALEVDPQLTAYNMNAVITNPLLASNYKISFWGAYRQKKGDDTSYTYIRTLGHDQTGNNRHDNLNQTAWMWNWINNSVHPNMKATQADINAFSTKGRIVGTVNVTNNNRNIDKATVTKVDNFYTKRPTAAG